MRDYDFVIIGGGFYGCCLALFLRSISERILIVERGSEILSRASRVNQARVHTGFHYPRSVLTASKSMLLREKFTQDFSDAIEDNFQMLYAIARGQSKISANRFWKMFESMKAPIKPAKNAQKSLFDLNLIEDVYRCEEYAFNYEALRQILLKKLEQSKIEVRLETEVEKMSDRNDFVGIELSTGDPVRAGWAFNVTYAGLNDVLDSAELPRANLKFEIAELALIEPPEELEQIGVTVMDGPFFSAMPFPSEKLHSLTHVRYTPHHSWTSKSDPRNPYEVMRNIAPKPRHTHMIQDAKRFLPCLEGAHWKKSIFEVKAVLLKNEDDDGRPILFQRKPRSSRVVSVLGGKIDNIYDLFDIVQKFESEWSSVSSQYIFS